MDKNEPIGSVIWKELDTNAPEFHQQIMLKLDGDRRLSIIQGRSCHGKRAFGTVEFWDYQAPDPTEWADGKELYEFLKKFYEPTAEQRG